MPEDAKCQCQSSSHGHKPGDCEGQFTHVYAIGRVRDSQMPVIEVWSRRKVEKLLRTGGVPVTVIRAGIIVGHGGISWELTRQLVEHLPLMITPRWVATRTQPIAVDDAVRKALDERSQAKRDSR